MSELNEANNWLMGGGSGVRSAKWGAKDRDDDKVPGFIEMGEIVDVKMVVQYVYDADKGNITNEVATWADGTEKKQMRIIIQTATRDDDEDDGRRAIYVRGGDLKAQLQEAIRAANAQKVGLEAGGRLAVKFLQSKKINGKWNNFWECRYKAPDKVNVDEFMGTGPSVPTPVQPGYQQPVQQPIYQQPVAVPQGLPMPQGWNDVQAQPQPTQVPAGPQPQVDLNAPWDTQVHNNQGNLSAFELATQRAQQANAALNQQAAQQPQPQHVSGDDFEKFGF